MASHTGSVHEISASADRDADGLAPRFARGPVLGAAGALAVVLGALANLYGYHRDELYFRLLPPAWGYVDQPPLTPALARLLSGLTDEPWALRLPAIVCAVASVIVVALITREVGGGRLAQGLAAWGYAFGSFTLAFGHVLLTASIDLLVWPAVVLAVIKAVRRDARWWLVAGAIVGLSTYNKLLIALLLVALAAGLAVVGPRRVLRSAWLYAGVGLIVVIGLPNLVYQWANGWPQLAMGGALSGGNGDEVRVLMWPFLLLLLGPPLVPFWVAGIVAPFRRREWADLRFVPVAFGVLLVLVALAGAQFYYPYGLLVCLYALGCVPVARWAGSSRGRRVLVVAVVALNSAVSSVISLPVVPVGLLGATPIPAINQSTADQVGWPRYVAQVEAVAATVAADAATSPARTAIVTSNYGEAGALDRFGSSALPPVFSGHNALASLGRPADDVDTVIVVGALATEITPLFERCDAVAELDNGDDVDNEEQGEPIAVCRHPLTPWSDLWPRLAHLD
ncbi:glycosyltransferase family 39 protein [Herbiconiux daphne]|uniref:Glycosyltransferase family 39 protein n=1 Tax=Herbiconiux daphne TaxID=2970914 RepID=A0ABT2H6M1_9MICO|nr:glycosyltransferase family 39 protein [Herbiconiux daphne]MCS5735610.1 glycosyltransferase family 39 protein [Herbiconiux daphne]